MRLLNALARSGVIWPEEARSVRQILVQGGNRLIWEPEGLYRINIYDVSTDWVNEVVHKDEYINYKQEYDKYNEHLYTLLNKGLIQQEYNTIYARTTKTSKYSPRLYNNINDKELIRQIRFFSWEYSFALNWFPDNKE